jgi:hypothetical protein
MKLKIYCRAVGFAIPANIVRQFNLGINRSLSSVSIDGMQLLNFILGWESLDRA